MGSSCGMGVTLPHQSCGQGEGGGTPSRAVRPEACSSGLRYRTVIPDILTHIKAFCDALLIYIRWYECTRVAPEKGLKLVAARGGTKPCDPEMVRPGLTVPDGHDDIIFVSSDHQLAIFSRWSGPYLCFSHTLAAQLD